MFAADSVSSLLQWHLVNVTSGVLNAAVGTQKLYKEDICICLCRVYVISYIEFAYCFPLPHRSLRCFGAFLHWGWHSDCDHTMHNTITLKTHSKHSTNITKLSVSLHRIQFQAGRGLAVTDWRIFVILPSRPQCCLSAPHCPHTHIQRGALCGGIYRAAVRHPSHRYTIPT